MKILFYRYTRRADFSLFEVNIGREPNPDFSMRSTIIESAIYYQKNWGDGQQIEIRHHLYAKRTYFFLKRCMDLSVALLISGLIFPWLFPIVMLLIRLDSKGPIFFKQKRVGFLGKI